MLSDNNILDEFSEDDDCLLSKTGSRVICNPAPEDTDIDYLAYVPEHKQHKFLCMLCENDFVVGGDDSSCDDEEEFQSFKRGNLNIILTFNEAFYRKFKLATKVAKKLNLLKKEDRIMLFQAILYGNSPTF